MGKRKKSGFASNLLQKWLERLAKELKQMEQMEYGAMENVEIERGAVSL